MEHVKEEQHGLNITTVLMSSTRSTEPDCHYKDAPFQGPA